MTALPLIVDLDGTLVDTDMLHELAVKSIAQAPFRAIFWPLWLAKGKAYLKQQISATTDFDAALLPYNKALLAWLEQQAGQGRDIVLCTASDQVIASAIADHLGFFSEVMASDGSNNLSGDNKAQALVDKFGEHEFDYCGNAEIDLKVWRRGRHAIVVNGSQALLDQANALTRVEQAFTSPRQPLKVLGAMLSRYRWFPKTITLMVALLVATAWMPLVWVVMGLSVLYVMFTAGPILLDLLNIEKDRQQGQTMSGFASGITPIWYGVALVAGTGAFSLLGLAVFVIAI